MQCLHLSQYSVKLCSIMQILASFIPPDMVVSNRDQRQVFICGTSDVLVCSPSLTLFENERVDLCDLCVLSVPFSPPFYNDSNLDHKRCQWNLIFSVIITLVQLGFFRILIGFLPIWNIFFFFAILGKRWNCSLLSIVTKLKSQNMTFDEVQDPI